MSFVQGTSVQGNGVTSVTTPALTTTSGNALTVGSGVQIAFGGDVTSVTDSKSNTLTQVTNSPVGSAGPKSRVYTAKNITGGSSHTWTTNTATSSYIVKGIGEFAGRHTSSLVDTDASLLDATTLNNHVGPALTPVANADLWCFQCTDSAVNPTVVTVGSGWTKDRDEVDGSNGTSGHTMYQNNVSASAVTGAYTTGTPVISAGIMVSLKVAGSSTSRFPSPSFPQVLLNF